MNYDFFTLLFDPNLSLLRDSVLFLLFISVAVGVSGSYITVSHSTYLAATIGHTILGGIGLSLYLSAISPLFSWFSPTLGSYLAGFFSLLCITLVERYFRENSDALFSLLWASGMAIGVLFMALSPTKISPDSYLLGDLLLITKGERNFALVWSAILLILLRLFYPYLNASLFDGEFLQAKGISLTAIRLTSRLALAITTIALTQGIGIILVVAVLSIPPMTVQPFCGSLKKTMLYSSLLFLFSGLISFYLGFQLNLPLAPLLVLLMGTLYLLSLPLRKRVLSQSTSK